MAFLFSDRNCALFTSVLCNILVLCINEIQIYGWKHSYCRLNGIIIMADFITIGGGNELQVTQIM